MPNMSKRSHPSLTICQECGKTLSSWSERHTFLDCGEYHLERAVEILGREKVLVKVMA